MSGPEYPDEEFGGRDRWGDGTPLYVVFKEVGAAVGAAVQKIGEAAQGFGGRDRFDDDTPMEHSS